MRLSVRTFDLGRAVTLIGLCWAVLGLQPAFSQSLEELEAIVSESPSLAAFLSDPARVTRYYEAARKYLGSTGEGAFPRESFDRILEVFADLVAAHPEFAELAWLKRTPRTGFAFEVANAQLSDGFLDRLLLAFGLSETELLSDQANPLWRLEMASLEALLAESRVTGLRRGGTLQSMRRREEVVRFDRSLKAELIRRSGLIEAARKGNVFEVVKSIEKIIGQPETLIDQVQSSAVQFILRPMQQRLTDLTRDPDLFPRLIVGDPHGVTSNFSFRFLARRFHALFVNLPYSECIGGACDRLADVLAARIAIPTLPEAEIIEVKQDGRLAGWISLLRIGRPINLLTDRALPEQIYSVEARGVALKQVKLGMRLDGTIHEANAFDFFVEGLSIQHPEMGLTLTANTHPHNGHGLSSTMGSIGFLESTPLGHVSRLRPEASLEHRQLLLALNRFPRPFSAPGTYRGESTLHGALFDPIRDFTLYALSPPRADSLEEAIETRIHQAAVNPETIYDVRLWSLLSFHNELSERFKPQLSAMADRIMAHLPRRVLTDQSEAHAYNAFMSGINSRSLATLVAYATLDANNVFGVAQKLLTLQRSMPDFNHKQAFEVFWMRALELIESMPHAAREQGVLGTRGEESAGPFHNRVFEKTFMSYQVDHRLRQAFVASVHRVEVNVAILSHLMLPIENADPTDYVIYRKKMSGTRIAFLTALYQQHPEVQPLTFQQVRQLMNTAYDLEEYELIARLYLAHVPNAGRFVQFIEALREGGTDSFTSIRRMGEAKVIRLVERLVSEQFGRLEGDLKASAEQLLSVLFRANLGERSFLIDRIPNPTTRYFIRQQLVNRSFPYGVNRLFWEACEVAFGRGPLRPRPSSESN